ncbi:MAG: DUF2071 domain-containing protein [Chthoniobacteraceae bacterium]|jgi:uncharacterized protein YqjF (DUF2071 family)
MNTTRDASTDELSRLARARIGRPLFCADWLDVFFLYYEVDPSALQPLVPFPLHLRDGAAYLSLVSFTLRRMRPPFTGPAARIGEWLLRPVSNHRFLNARTYVRAGGETGIYFLAEWLSTRFPVPLGRPLFGLPYHFAKFQFHNDSPHLNATISARRERLSFEARIDLNDPAPCPAGSLDEFLLERYTAFTYWRGLRRLFRVWHPPWPASPVAIEVNDASLLRGTGDWFRHATLIAAHHSPGVNGVMMGSPNFLN